MKNMRNLYNDGVWPSVPCWELASQTGYRRWRQVPPLSCDRLSLADDAVTKAVTTSVDNVKLYLKNSVIHG